MNKFIYNFLFKLIGLLNKILLRFEENKGPTYTTVPGRMKNRETRYVNTPDNFYFHAPITFDQQKDLLNALLSSEYGLPRKKDDNTN